MPDFLVIGAPKAGTTALHAALARHPGLFMSAIKEPKFFLLRRPACRTKGGPGDALTYREHIWRSGCGVFRRRRTVRQTRLPERSWDRASSVGIRRCSRT